MKDDNQFKEFKSKRKIEKKNSNHFQNKSLKKN
jgi:hypothetical protein